MNCISRLGYCFILCASLIGCSSAIGVGVDGNFPEGYLPKVTDLKISEGSDKKTMENYYMQSVMIGNSINKFINDHPDYIKALSGVVNASQEHYMASASGDEKKIKKTSDNYKKLQKAFLKKYSEKELVDLFNAYLAQIGLWVSSHHNKGTEAIDNAFTMSGQLMVSLADKLPVEYCIKYYFLGASYLALMGDLKLANAKLAVAEDMASAAGSEEIYNSFEFNMTRGMNDYFLGNLSAAIALLESAPEHSDQEHDWYMYNNLNLYLIYFEQDKKTGQEFLQNFLNTEFSEKNKSSWAYQILKSLNSDRPGDLIAQASEFSKNAKELSENLCEAYYYLGMKYYLEGAKDIAHLFWVLSREQNVFYFLEYDYSTRAINKYFK